MNCLCVIGYEYPVYYENGIARGVNYLKNRGAGGVPFILVCFSVGQSP